MAWYNFLRPKTIHEVVRVHDDDNRSSRHSYGSGKTKYGNIRYSEAGFTDYQAQRDNSRGVYSDSLIARGMTGRLVESE